MFNSHLKHAVLCAAMVATSATVITMASGYTPRPLPLSLGVPRRQTSEDTARVARTTRRDLLVAADAATWAARSAMRGEPRVALSGIPQTTAERHATSRITDKFGDRSAVLNRDDRLANRAAGELSTLMADIAALRLEQRAALRATLNLIDRVRFDTNVATLIANRG